jgi:homoserine/homoserine lactone efflux protein
MRWQVWFLFAATEAALCIAPGPAVLLVLAQALKGGTAQAIWSILGILAANTAYFVLSAAGVGGVLIASGRLFFAVKWIGVAYLLWLGFVAFRGQSHSLSLAPAPDARVRGRRLFANGFILQMSNPKALVFFTALVPQFIDPRRAILPQMAILAITSGVIEFLVQLGYAALAGRASAFALRPRFAATANRVAGSLLVAAGLGMAAIRQT